jgi:cytochrome c oxidase subunit II
MERFEKAFLWAAAIVLVIFLGALAYSSLAMGIHLPSHFGMIHYTADQKLRKVLRKTPPFDHPGVHEVAPGKYQAVVIGLTWAFMPDLIEVPAGADVTFVATSMDVIHGFFIPGTRVNMMLFRGRCRNSTTASASRVSTCSFVTNIAGACTIRCRPRWW